MLKQFQRWLHFYFLNRQLRSRRTERGTMKLADAADIGILFDASDPDKVSLVNNFADSLKKQKKRIVMLGYYDTPKRAINFNFSYFNRKDINWFLEPRGDTVKDFISKKFDVLINAYLDESLTLEYVSAL